MRERGTMVLIGPLMGLAALSAGCGPRADSHRTVVTRVIDGDTIDVATGDRTTRVRLTGIDTPELARPARDGRAATVAECYAPEARRGAATLVPPGTEVVLERDVVARDDYGRLLAYVYRADDGLFVNRELLRLGFARPLTIEPNRAHRDTLVAAAWEAAEQGAGLWAVCHDERRQ